jgi:hypothetical protein
VSWCHYCCSSKPANAPAPVLLWPLLLPTEKACQQHKLLPVCPAAAPATAPAVALATAPAAVPACCLMYWPSVSLLQLRHQSTNHKTQPQPQKPLQAISQERRDSTIAIGSARTVQRTQRPCSNPHVKEEYLLDKRANTPAAFAQTAKQVHIAAPCSV